MEGHGLDDHGLLQSDMCCFTKIHYLVCLITFFLQVGTYAWDGPWAVDGMPIWDAWDGPSPYL